MSPVMAGALQPIAFVTGWMAFTLLAIYFIRLYVIRGDVIAEANQIIDETETIESFIAAYLPRASR